MTQIAIVLFDGFTDIDVFLHWDLLNRPKWFRGDLDWEVVLLGTEESHTSRTGLRVPTHGRIDRAGEADAVIHTSGPATRTLKDDASYLARLGLSAERQLLGAQCSGSLILAACGALEGLTATTYPTAIRELEGLGVRYVAEPFVAHGNVATAAGCLAGVELDRWLITRLADAELARECIESASPVSSELGVA